MKEYQFTLERQSSYVCEIELTDEQAEEVESGDTSILINEWFKHNDPARLYDIDYNDDNDFVEHFEDIT